MSRVTKKLGPYTIRVEFVGIKVGNLCWNNGVEEQPQGDGGLARVRGEIISIKAVRGELRIKL
jgi:hypothetical protein